MIRQIEIIQLSFGVFFFSFVFILINSEGSYRQVFGLQHSFEEQHEQIVIKKMYSR
jgi:hypothetical protein